MIEPLALRQEVLHAYTRSLSTIWIVSTLFFSGQLGTAGIHTDGIILFCDAQIATPLLFIGLILSFCLRHYSIDRTVVRTNGTDQKKEGEGEGEVLDGVGSEKVLDEEAGEGLEMKTVQTSSNASQKTVGEIPVDDRAVTDDVQKVIV